jgi:hypothetical protein
VRRLSKGAPELIPPADLLVVQKLPLVVSRKIDTVALSQLVREGVNQESVG